MPEHAGGRRQSPGESRREMPRPRTRRSGVEVTRRAFLRTAVASGVALAGGLTVPSVITPARGAEKSIKIGIWAGPDGELIKSTIVKRFEEKYRVKVLIDEGITTEQLARMRASKNNPTHTVMFMDDIGVTVAHREGLIDRLPEDKIPNLANVIPRYISDDGHGVGIQVSTVALTYDPRELKTAPTSWEAFWDPKHKGKVAVPSLSSTNGINLVVTAAALATGKPFKEAQYETEAAFQKLAELKPNLHSIWTKTPLAVSAMQQGELVMMGPMYSKGIWPYIDRGLSATHIVPQEGAFAGVNCQTLVKGGPHPELGAAFINEMLSAESQTLLANKLIIAPVVTGVELPPKILERVAYGDGKEETLFVSDWEFLINTRPDWTERWNKVFS
jgi:putative spermidine/putrescine transport system substrate-binding protein